MSIHADIVGLMAGFFTILAFYSKQPLSLRAFALCANVLFVTYAIWVNVLPILILHAILLPLNLIRYAQLRGFTLARFAPDFRAMRGLAGIVMVCIAAVLWATVGVTSELMAVPVEPALAGLARTFLGCLVILAFTVTSRTPTPVATGNRIWPLLTFGVFCAMFQICLFSAFKVVGVTITIAVTVCLPPLLVQLVDAFWNKVRLERSVLLAMGVAIVGVVLVLFENGAGAMSETGASLYGGAMLIIASMAFAGVAIAARTIGAGGNALQDTGIGLGICAVVLMVSCMALPVESLEMIRSISLWDAGLLAYVGIFATGLAYLCFVYGLSLSRSAGVGMAATLIEPVAAAVMAAYILHERLSAIQTLGCVTMLFAIVLLLKNEAGRRTEVSNRSFGAVAEIPSR